MRWYEVQSDMRLVCALLLLLLLLLLLQQQQQQWAEQQWLWARLRKEARGSLRLQGREFTPQCSSARTSFTQTRATLSRTMDLMRGEREGCSADLAQQLCRDHHNRTTRAAATESKAKLSVSPGPCGIIM